MQKVMYRPLRVYAFDPSRGRSLGNHMTVNVRYEELEPGPVGGKVAVIDYDPANGVFYKPVDLDDHDILLAGGLMPSEADPQFHQQMAYAVASETIQTFEVALGRPIRWAFKTVKGTAGADRRLRIYPHAFRGANAFYSRDLRALLFGYFNSTQRTANGLAQSEQIFACLSHDIVAHETTHALIDSQRRYFVEPTGPDTLAFHEAFADVVALFQHFSFKEALLDTIQKTGGNLHRLAIKPDVEAEGDALIQAEVGDTNPMVDLAKQFGDAMGRRAALRTALGSKPNSADIDRLFEAHDRGAILVAAVFDAFFTSFIRRTRDLFRIARSGGMPATPGDLHPDLANRLSNEAARTARHFATMCIRALDYCPPVDISFGDFLRAVITADSELFPDDPHEYREALIRAFRSRGIKAAGAVSFSEDSLRWAPPPQKNRGEPPRCEQLNFMLLRENTDDEQRSNAKALHAFADRNRSHLGLDRKLPVRVASFHPIVRWTKEGQRVEVVVEYMQQKPQIHGNATFTFRGGATAVFNADGSVKFAVGKNINDKTRLERQRDYYREFDASLAPLTYKSAPWNPYAPDDDGSPERVVDFRALHRGW